jgi:uncharacterized protein YegJ (DUF2314 family)
MGRLPGGALPLMALLLMCSGCGSDIVRRAGEPDFINVPEDDPQMTAAIAQARASADRFIAALNHPQPGQKGFSVKARITDGRNTEHMWLTPIRYEGGKFIGAVNNEPVAVRGVKIGDQRSVPPAEISDWMYVDGEKLVGGFTIRVLRDRVPEHERREFDRGFPFKMD